MRAYTVNSFQMFRMHQKSRKFISIPFQTKKHPQTYIVNTAFHGSVHGFGMIGIVVFRACGMELFIAFFMISFLEQDVCTDASFFQHPIFFYCGCCNVHIHSADGTIFMLNGINGLNTFQNIFNGVIHRVFPSFQRQTFMPHVL